MSNRVSRRQAGRWADQEQAQAYQQQQYYQQQPAYAPPPPPPPPAETAPSMEDKLAQLTQLGQLKDQGILTEAEFEAQKTAILNA